MATICTMSKRSYYSPQITNDMGDNKPNILKQITKEMGGDFVKKNPAKVEVKDIENYKVNINEILPMPEVILSILDANSENKRMVFTRENISCITAQHKVGKTWLVKLIVSACLIKKPFQKRLISEMPDGHDKILYIDTEQSKYHVQLGLHQIKQMLENVEKGTFKNVENKLEIFGFDTLGAESCFNAVKGLIYTKKYSLIIIDGIADLCFDTNDLRESAKLVTDLRIWASENNCHIVNVIHLNPGDLSQKMKGHLGTKLGDKSEIILSVNNDRHNENLKVVKSVASRNRNPEPFAFTILESGIPQISEFEVQLNTKFKIESISKLDQSRLIVETFRDVKELTYTPLVESLTKAYKKLFKDLLGKNVIKEFITYSKNENLIYQPKAKGPYLESLKTEIPETENKDAETEIPEIEDEFIF